MTKTLYVKKHEKSNYCKLLYNYSTYLYTCINKALLFVFSKQN